MSIARSRWADAGECTSNPGYMLQACANACGEVDEEQRSIQEKLKAVGSFYDLKCNDLDGNPVNFADFRGKVVVVVNVASQCGYTESHYRGLVQLFEDVREGGAEILAFPCNQFGRQEPGSADEIKAFAASKGVTFRMMEKVDVNGAGAHLVYLYLKDQAGISSITWNFATYFVVSPDGDVESYTGVEPMDLSKIVQLLQNQDEL
jgi:glutathione peroxidase